MSVVLEMRIVDEDGVEGVRSFSPQLLETLEQAAAQKLESLNLSSKVISWLPESIGLVTNLTSLDLSGVRSHRIPWNHIDLGFLWWPGHRLYSRAQEVSS
jgi:hypothetical protein